MMYGITFLSWRLNVFNCMIGVDKSNCMLYHNAALRVNVVKNASGVELSMRSFFVISVSGMGFSAGGSVVPEVT